MKLKCSKCGFKYEYNPGSDDDCSRCVAIKAKYPDLIEYVEACIAKAKDDADKRAWEEYMGDDL